MTRENWNRIYREAPEVFAAFARAEDPERRVAAALARHVRLADRRVLEVGSGTGRLARALAQATRAYVAVEPSAPLIAVASEGPTDRVHRLRARGEALPLRDRSIDVVVAAWVFAYLPTGVRERALAEASRVLTAAPGGAGIWLIENHWQSEFNALRGRPEDALSAECRPLVEAGFGVVDTVETQIRFETADECRHVLGLLCGDDVAARLDARPRRVVGQRVVLLSCNG